MALNPNIRDQAYQFFVEEAPELLQSLEAELLTLSQEHSTTKIHALMRTAHSIKGGAASVGLEPIATLAHRLENVFKALYDETLDINVELENQLLQAYDCLRLPLTQQIVQGSFNGNQALAIAEPIFSQIETQLGDALTETEHYIPSSSDLGVDMISSILEVDVGQGLEHLARVLDRPDEYEVGGELRAQVEVFGGFAELLNLPALGAIAELAQRALDRHPERAFDITQLALQDFERIRTLVLHTQAQTSDAIEVGASALAPSPELVALVNESDWVETTAVADGDRESEPAITDAAAADLMAETDNADEGGDDMEASLFLLEDVFGSALDSDSTGLHAPLVEDADSIAEDRSAPESVPNSATASEDPPPVEAGLNATSTAESDTFDHDAADSDTAESDIADLDTADLDMPISDTAGLDTLDYDMAEHDTVEHDAPEDSESATADYPEHVYEADLVTDADVAASAESDAAAAVEDSRDREEDSPDSVVHIFPYPSNTVSDRHDPDLIEGFETIDEMVQSVENEFDGLPSLADMADDGAPEPSQNPDADPRVTSSQATDVQVDDSQPPAGSSGLVPLNWPGSSLASSSQPEPQDTAAYSRRPTASFQSDASVAPNLTVRVETARLERMNNLVGELAINRDGISLQNDQLQGALKELLSRFSRFQDRIDKLRNLSDQLLTAPEYARRSARAYRSDGNASSSAAANGEATRAPSTAPYSTLASPWSTEFDSLEMDNYGDLHVQLQEIFEDVFQLEEMVGDVTLFSEQSDSKLSQQKQMLIQLRDDLTWARMVPLSEILNRFPRILRDLSLAYNKPVRLQLLGTSVLVDKSVLEKLYDPLLHLLRNAFDHGIEPPNIRRRNGKPEEGEITVRAYHRGNQTIIQIEDDGQGLNLDRISDRALQRGWLTIDQVASIPVKDLYEFIFEPGFSTAHQVSEISGRGIGLDVVRAQLSEIKGSVSVTSSPGRGTTFTLYLPLTLAITKLITFLSGSVVLAISADSVEEIMTPLPAQIRQLGRQRFLQRQDTVIPLCSMAELLTYNCPLPDTQPSKLFSTSASSSPEKHAPVLILNRDRQMFAVEVDRIITEQELVVKPFGSAIAPPPYTYGCTILGDGSLVPVIDGTELPLSDVASTSTPGTVSFKPETGDRHAFSSRPQFPEVKTVQTPTLLVVDDSATLRRTLALSLERVGFRVLQAQDGQEAIKQLQRVTSIQLVICDIEMPNMNGFEFLSHRRQDPTLANIPVVMLTSRSNEKHRWLATQLGATAYFTKPYLEQDFIDTLEDILH